MDKLIITTLMSLLHSTISFGQTKCDVNNFYKAVEAENDVLVLTTGGDIEEAEYIMIPTKLDKEKYKLSVTR